MVRKTLAGLIIAVAAVGVTPIAASAAVDPVSHSEQASSQTGRVTPEAADPTGGMMPIIGLWAGVGVLGLTGGMVTIAAISRKQKPAVSRVAAAMS
ncbi:hypothetical protein [Herbiconiux ginsengi]|uniref:LPXTG-motif cell wall anchor domain-containing protein n=1 Tax=Herbiconiux ginsengi TaxID=381665 RepID=A0A1H3SNZ7_9MICO|nr:hypothetical protein [Herbiconiux ginsengi]SDZ39398.1 hypothetical protein SAMN05216554_3518 [Herbiconiux ginsengi]